MIGKARDPRRDRREEEIERGRDRAQVPRHQEEDGIIRDRLDQGLDQDRGLGQDQCHTTQEGATTRDLLLQQEVQDVEAVDQGRSRRLDPVRDLGPVLQVRLAEEEVVLPTAEGVAADALSRLQPTGSAKL